MPELSHLNSPFFSQEINYSEILIYIICIVLFFLIIAYDTITRITCEDLIVYWDSLRRENYTYTGSQNIERIAMQNVVIRRR
jgi:hypothetical protein